MSYLYVNVLRSTLNNTKQKYLIKIIFLKIKIKQDIYMDVFQNIEDHTSNQCVLNNRREQLINLIIDLFLNVRLRHIGTIVNDDVFKSSFMQKFTKLITHMNH